MSCVLQILTRMQVAVWIVHLYPYIPVLEEVLEGVAMAMHEPSKEDVMAMAQQDPMNAEWAELEEYVEMVVAKDPHAYVPVPRGFACSCTSNNSQ